MSEIPASYSILPTYVKDALSGDLLEIHRLALRSIDLLAELRARVNEIKWHGSRNLIPSDGARRRFLAATIELHEIWDTYTTVDVYDHVACALIESSQSKESIKYEENLGECFHELVLRMVGMNLSALFMLPFPLHWKSDKEQLMGWLAVDASRQFESAKFHFGVGGKDGWWLQSELRREAIGVEYKPEAALNTNPRHRMEFFLTECRVRLDDVKHDVSDDAYRLIQACWNSYPRPSFAKDLDGDVRPGDVKLTLPKELKAVFRSGRGGKGCWLKLSPDDADA